MVAVMPEHAGKGLGKVLTAAVLRYFKRQNLGSAYLHTDEQRLAAIRTYLEMGFEPVPTNEETRGIWADVLESLGRPELAHRYCGGE
jgi:mycothiol synthase